MARNPYEPQFYLLGPDHQLIACELMEWAANFEHADRVVAQTGRREYVDGDWRKGFAGIQVSTVFLGLDHRFFGDGPPLVFETMVFGGPHDSDMERYGSWAAAEAGHQRMVAKVFPALAKINKHLPAAKIAKEVYRDLAKRYPKVFESAKSARETNGSAGAKATSTPAKPQPSSDPASTPTPAPTSFGRSAAASLARALKPRR